VQSDLWLSVTPLRDLGAILLHHEQLVGVVGDKVMASRSHFFFPALRCLLDPCRRAAQLCIRGPKERRLFLFRELTERLCWALESKRPVSVQTNEPNLSLEPIRQIVG